MNGGPCPIAGPGGGLLEYVTRLSRFDIDINPLTGAISNFRIKETDQAQGSQ